MELQDRLKEIMNIISDSSYASVDYLSSELGISPSAVRRALNILESQGYITRSYGGAEIKDTFRSMPNLFLRRRLKSEKNRMALYASRLIKSGDTVFLDGSNTVQYMKQYLSGKKDISVITNNIMLAAYLKEKGVSVHVTGGELTKSAGTLLGPLAAQGFDAFHADIMFFSTDGVMEDGTVTVETDESCIANRAMINNSDKHVLLCSHDKIGKCSRLVQCDFSEIDTFISDKPIDEKFKKSFPNTEYICTTK